MRSGHVASFCPSAHGLVSFVLIGFALLAGPLAAAPPAYSTLHAVPIQQLGAPEAIAVDPVGTLYVADTANHRILAHALDGTTRLIAGSGKPGSKEGLGAAAQFQAPAGIAFDPLRNVLVVADTGNHAIRRVSLDGAVITIAGGKRPGFVDGPGTNALFQAPRGVTVAADGTIFVADSLNHAIRAIGASGAVTTIANSLGTPGMIDGAAADSRFHEPFDVEILERPSLSPLLLVADRLNHAIRAIDLGTAQVTTLAGVSHPGFADGPTFAAAFAQPSSLVAWDGYVWVADSGNHAIRMIDLAAATVSTLAGSGRPGNRIGPLAQAEFKSPSGIAFAGALWIADSGNDAIKVTYPAPSLTSVTPGDGPSGGGTRVTLAGAGFMPGARVAFGTAAATNVVWLSASSIQATTPAGFGLVNVSVTTAEGSATLANGFRFGPSLVSVTITPATVRLSTGQEAQLRATGGYSDGSTADFTSLATWESSDPSVASIAAPGRVIAHDDGSITITARYLGFIASASVVVSNDDVLPPDGEVQATPIDPTVVTELADATRFLYEGPGAVQHDVAPGAIDDVRVAIVRGRVLDTGSSPLGGVRVEVLANTPLGWTSTRSSGIYELAVNGGGTVTLVFAKDGYLPVHRQVEVPWRDFAVLDDIVLTPLDPVVTTVTMGGGTPQTVAGSPIADADGARTARLFIPAATAAELVLADGTRVPAATLSIRATEYTVGDEGLAAMPAGLPPNSGYTYCVELSADEALAAGAVSVDLSHPIAFHLENFLGFPAGTPVPSGYYDRTKGEWIASENGLVVGILSVDGGSAALDLDGDAVADSEAALAAIGISAEERGTLALRYAAGTSIWRIPIRHFTPWDFNWPYGPPSGAGGPSLPPCDPQDPNSPCANRTGGSVIECENQTLGEIVPIEGTPYSLVYRSDRVPGHTGAAALKIPVSGASVPSLAKRIEVEITVAGRRYVREFERGPNQSFIWEWDGKDAWGRELRGRFPIHVRRSFVYDGVYQRPGEFERSFAEFSGVPMVENRARQEIHLFQDWDGALGAFSADPASLGSWSLDAQHHFDSGTREFHYGGGGTAGGPEGEIFRTVLRKVGQVYNIYSVTAAPDGSIYATDYARLWRLEADGTKTHIGGNGGYLYNGDGIPATEATLYGAAGIAVGKDGSIFVAERHGLRVRRIDPSGIIWTIAGTGNTASDYWNGEGGAATNADLGAIESLALAPDGSIYLGMPGLIRRISPGGRITTVAGHRDATVLGDGGPALLARLGAVHGIAIAKDGSIVFSDTFYHRIRRIGTDGIIRTIAGNGISLPKYTDPRNTVTDLPALSANLDHPSAVALDSDGSVYFFDRNCYYPACWPGSSYGFLGTVRRLTPDGVVAFVSGRIRTQGGIERPPDGIEYRNGFGLAPVPGGGILIGSFSEVWKLQPAYPGFRTGQTLLPAAGGDAFHVFDRAGRHLATRDYATGVTRASFAYSGGKLASITDEFGRTTTIQRGGNTTRIVAPNGKETVLTTDGNGFVASIAAPGGVTSTFEYSADGLLRSMRGPRGFETTFDYDDRGRLTSDRDAAGGEKLLTFTGSSSDAFEVALRDGMGRITRYALQDQPDGTERQSVREPSGLLTSTVRRSSESVTTYPDGSRLTAWKGADPIFGLLAPSSSFELRTPSGRRFSFWSSRSVTGPGPGALENVFEGYSINSRYWQAERDVATGVRTITSPMSRRSEQLLNPNGQLAEIRVPGIAPTTFSYNGAGRLSGISQSGAGYSLVWSPEDELVSITDPLGRSVGFTYDDAGRVTTQRLPDGRIIGFAWDAAGNLASITPPGRPAHAFDYSAVDLETAYRPPAVSGSGATATRYEYNLARDLTKVIRPDGLELSLGYDGGGRLATLATPTGTYGYTYDSSGNLASIGAPGATTLAYGWDGFLPTSVRWSGSVAGEVGWTYNDGFTIATEKVNGAPIAFDYDLDSLLTKAGAMTIRRDAANGRITGTTLSRLTDEYGYDANGRMATYVMRDGATEVLRLEYGRDTAGRIVEKRESRYGVTLVENYGYDLAGRLETVHRNGVLEATYAYDANGNRLSKTTPSEVETGTYDAQDRMASYAGATYTYTANGELRTKTDASGTTTYDYDVLGNLRRVDLPDGTVIEYVIDGQNRRVGKKVNGVLERGWLYADQLNPIAELDGAGNVVSRFVYGTRTNVPDYMIRGSVTYRIVSDHLGSVKYVIDVATGAVIESISHDPWGMPSGGSGVGSFGFAGGISDQSTGLVYFASRDYDPFVGRWATKDPILFDGGDSNLYAYVFGDPVNFVDPTGLDAITSDATVRQYFYDLWKKAGYGSQPTERAGWITQDPETGEFKCVKWPWSAANASETWKGPLPPNMVGLAHTHPDRGKDPKPSTGGSKQNPADDYAAKQIQAGVYTISRRGIWKIDPSGAITKEEGSDWMKGIDEKKCKPCE